MGLRSYTVSRDTLRRFVFFVYVCLFIHLWRRDTALMLSVSKFNKLSDNNRYCIKITSYLSNLPRLFET